MRLQITYSLLTDSSGDHHLFRIDPDLGIVYTEAVFDREARSSYLLEVQSEDGQESARPGKNKKPNSGRRHIYFSIKLLMEFCFMSLKE